MSNNPNSGHGHVRPRPDGLVARCGGPEICSECREELENQKLIDGLLDHLQPYRKELRRKGIEDAL